MKRKASHSMKASRDLWQGGYHQEEEARALSGKRGIGERAYMSRLCHSSKFGVSAKELKGSIDLESYNHMALSYQRPADSGYSLVDRKSRQVLND